MINWIMWKIFGYRFRRYGLYLSLLRTYEDGRVELHREKYIEKAWYQQAQLDIQIGRLNKVEHWARHGDWRNLTGEQK